MTRNKVTRNQLQKELENSQQRLVDTDALNVYAEQIKEELRQSEELQRITLSNITDVVFITDHVGNFTFISPNADIIFGYSAEEVRRLGNIVKLLGSIPVTLAELEARREVRNIELDWKLLTKTAGVIHC